MLPRAIRWRSGGLVEKSDGGETDGMGIVAEAVQRAAQSVAFGL